MKKIVLMLLTIGVLMACQEKQPVRFTTSSPEISTFKKMIDDYEKANWSSWATMYSDTAKIYHNNWDNSSTVAEIQKGHESLNVNLSSYGFDKDQMVVEQNLDDDGETWVNFWSLWKGKLRANGKEIHIPVHLTAQFVDGKVVEEYGFWNMSEYVAELQAIEAAAAAAEEETEDGD
jgi:hypothetical protein